MTGIIIVAGNTPSSEAGGYGRLKVKYLAAADQAYTTTFQLSDDGGANWSTPVNVLPWNTASTGTPKLAGTYKIKINAPPPQVAGPPQNVTIVEDQTRTVNVDYQ